MNQKTKELAAAVMLARNIGVRVGFVAAGMGIEAGHEQVRGLGVILFTIAGLGEQDLQEVETFLGELAEADAPLPPAGERAFQEHRQVSEWPSEMDRQRAEYQGIAELFRQARWEEATRGERV